MRTLVCSSLVFIAVAAAGCGGTDSTVSGVFPAEGFTGRTLRVEISGDATEWSGSPGVNFGDGVTVSNVTVASPTSLFADITIADDAAPGLHDVVVTNSGTFTLKQSFELKSPIEVSFQGVVAQGGAPYFTVINHDFDTPFDLTQDANGGYLNLIVTPPTGVDFSIQEATAYELKGFALIDTDATPGTFSIASGPTGMETAFNLGATLDVTARAPIPLTDTASGTLMNTGDSELYSVSVATAPALLRVLASSSATDAQPIAALLPGGKWSNAVNAALSIEQQSGTLDIVVFDGGTASGYNYSLKSKVEALASAAEAAGANDTIATALVAPSVPFVQTGGTLTGANEKDLIKIVLAAPAVVHVSAHSADDLTDTAVDIKNSAGTTSVLSPAGPQNDAGCFPAFGLGCGEDVDSPMLAAGTYYVEVSEGPDFDPADHNYTALIYTN